METGPYETVPLSEDEKDLLLGIFQTRLRFFFTVYISLTAMAGFMVINPFREYLVTLSIFKAIGIIFLGQAIPFIVIIGTGLSVFFKRILPFRRDALSGVKEKIPFTVLRKEYFPLTGQFFVALNDPDYLHHEIDEDTYHNVWDGCKIFLYRGAHSKYIFEENGRFTL